jgi:hypothetical protein
MSVLMVKTSGGMKPVDGNKLVLEEDGLKAVHSSVWTARPREPTAPKKGLIRRIIDLLTRKNV